MVVDVVFDLPIIPMKMSIQCLHGVAASDHECMRSVDVVRSIDMFGHLFRRMLGNIQMLSAEINEPPVFG